MSLSPGRCDLEKVYNTEGYVDNISLNNRYNYFRKDHLGTNREVWRASFKMMMKRKPPVKYAPYNTNSANFDKVVGTFKFRIRIVICQQINLYRTPTALPALPRAVFFQDLT